MRELLALGSRAARGLRGLLHGEAGEEETLHYAGLAGAERLQAPKRIVQGEDLVQSVVGHQVPFMEGHVGGPTAPLLGTLFFGIVDEDLAHGSCGHGEEMSPALISR